MTKLRLLFLLLFALTITSYSKSIAYSNNSNDSILLSANDWKDLNNFKTRFSKIKKEEELKQFFIDIAGYKEKLSNKINDSLQKFNFRNEDSLLICLNPFKDFITPTRIEEGTRFFLTINNKGFYNKAIKTKGKADDDFFHLLHETYGNEGEYMVSFPYWLTRRTCLSGSLKLGDSTTYIYYKKIYHQSKTYNLFNPQVLAIMDDLKENILGFKKYDRNKDEVIKELTLLKNLDQDIRTQIEIVIKDMKTNPDQYQFNCNDGGCTFE